MSSYPLVSVVIATKNRRDELLRVIASCLAQAYKPIEVLVYDDASTDDTFTAVRQRHPDVQIHRNDTSVGCLPLRNRMHREARGKYLLTLDDDCYFADPGTLVLAVDLLEKDAAVAAVAMPLIEPNRERPDNWPWMKAERGEKLGSFMAGMNLMRRDAVLAANGYRDFMVNYQEEKDLCLRLLDRGWSIVYGGGVPLVHLPSEVRNLQRVWLNNGQNSVLIPFLDAPWIYMLPNIAVSCLKMLMYRFSWKMLPVKLRGIGIGVARCVRYAHERTPVSAATYRLYRRLPKHAPAFSVYGRIPEPLKQAQE